MRILTATEMREVDRRAIEDIGVPSLVLMENAAIGVADAVAESFPEAAKVAIFCGPGNNGGDGLALARLLDARGYLCRVFLVIRGSRPKGDAAVQLGILEKLGFAVEELGPDADLAAVASAVAGYDLLVDALFGTGLTRPLEGHFAALCEWLGESGIPCVAVDLPSGLDASLGEPIGPHATADLTVTFAAPKLAHVFSPAAEASGALVVTDLGIPPSLVDEAPGSLHLLTEDDLAACLLPRDAASHKGTYGHALVVAGSPGKSGAAILAARAAVRGGAGLVTAAVPEPLWPVVDGGSVESLTLPLPAGEAGELVPEALTALREAVVGKGVVAIGPGLGTAEGTVFVVRKLVAEVEAPIVVDADGLNALAGRLGEVAARTSPSVLTPHPGEMARLLGTSVAEVQGDRIGAVRRAAEASGAVVVLKGHQTLVASPDGAVWVNTTGNPGMASGGSGDVLMGLLAALVAQGYDVLVASQLAVYLHGLAGDLALVPEAPEALAASDQVDALPRAFAALRAV